MTSNNDIRTNALLHAKVYIFNNEIIIGSSNASSNGINLEGFENNSWKEMNILLDDKQVVKETKLWFQNLLKSHETIEVNESILKDAKKFYSQRRKNRKIANKEKSILELYRENKEIFEEREKVAIIICREFFDPDEMNEETCKAIKDEANKKNQNM